MVQAYVCVLSDKQYKMDDASQHTHHHQDAHLIQIGAKKFIPVTLNFAATNASQIISQGIHVMVQADVCALLDKQYKMALAPNHHLHHLHHQNAPQVQIFAKK